MSLSSNIKMTTDWRNTLSGIELSNPKDVARREYEKALTDGSGDDNVDIIWHDRRLVTAATPTDDIDIYGGITDVFGNTLSFSAVKKLLIINLGLPSGADLEIATFTASDGEDILVGAAASNPWTAPFNGDGSAQATVGPDGPLLLMSPKSGYAVAAASSDVLRITHDGTDDIAYDIIIEGVSA